MFASLRVWRTPEIKNSPSAVSTSAEDLILKDKTKKRFKFDSFSISKLFSRANEEDFTDSDARDMIDLMESALEKVRTGLTRNRVVHSRSEIRIKTLRYLMALGIHRKNLLWDYHNADATACKRSWKPLLCEKDKANGLKCL